MPAGSAAPRYRRRRMPRRARFHLPDGVYHVTSKGTGGGFIFVDDFDRQAFVVLLQQVCGLFGLRIHVWCLMGTHYHLILEAKREQLTLAMHRLNGLYAQRFNRRHRRKGHLFEERFSSWVIRDEAHFHAALAYVVENPVRAGLCTDARDWRWTWSRYPLPRTAASPAAMAEGLSLGHGPKGHGNAALRRAGGEEADVNLTRAVDADGELLLDVGAPARARDDGERAREVVADHGKELVQPGQDPILAQQRHVNVRKKRPPPRLVGRRRQHNAAGVRKPVHRCRDPGPVDRWRLSTMNVKADRGRIGGEFVGEAHRRESRYLRPNDGRERPEAHARPGPTRPASGCPSRASRVVSR